MDTSTKGYILISIINNKLILNLNLSSEAKRLIKHAANNDVREAINTWESLCATEGCE